MASAIFLDRDGVINYNRSDYVKSPDEFVFLPGSAEAAARLTRAGLDLFIVSNQGGVGRGRMTDGDLDAVTETMVRGLAEAGARVRGIYYCRHHPDAGCPCRKPEPGLLRQAAREHGVDLSASIVIGDHARDLAAGAAVGARCVLVLSGLTARDELERLPVAPFHVAASLSDAVEWLLDSNA